MSCFLLMIAVQNKGSKIHNPSCQGSQWLFIRATRSPSVHSFHVFQSLAVIPSAHEETHRRYLSPPPWPRDFDNDLGRESRSIVGIEHESFVTSDDTAGSMIMFVRESLRDVLLQARDCSETRSKKLERHHNHSSNHTSLRSYSYVKNGSAT